MTSSGDVTMTVTLVDARHCPGSVMFLFDGYFGRILYTGNFRYEEGMLNQGCLSELQSNPVDVLYIDNTFCSPKCVLPSRQEAKSQLINIIEQHPKERVVFGVCGLGKEEILISLSKLFDIKITVSEERYRLLEVLALHEQFVMACERFEQTRFEVVEIVEITRSNVDAWSKSAPTIAVVLTGLFVGLGYQPFSASSDIFVVPLSDHSPYTELHEFMARIRPKSVVPIVRTDPGSRDDPLAASLLDRTNVECFAEHLDPTPMQNYHIPPSVLEMMNRTGNARSRTCKRTSSCRTSVSATGSPVSSSGQKLSPNSSALEVLAPTSSVKTSDSKIDCVRCKHVNTCNVLTSGVVRKPHVAVRPMKRCLPVDQCLQSRFIKQRQQHWVNLPALFELQRKRFSTNVVLPQECKRLPVSTTCMANSRVPSVTTKLNIVSSAKKQGNWTYKKQPDMSVWSDVASDVSSTVAGCGDTGSKNLAVSLWQSSENSVPTVRQTLVNTGRTMVNFAGSHKEGSEHIKEGCVSPTVTLLNHSNCMNTLAHNADGALNLTTSGVTNNQPSFLEVQDSTSLLTNACTSTGKHLDDSLQQHDDDNSSLFDDLQVNDQIYHHPVENEYLNVSQNHDRGDCNRPIVPSVNTESVNRSAMCPRERRPSTQLKVGVIFDNHCETAVFGGDRNTANAAAMVHSGLPGGIDASSNRMGEVLPVSRVERDIGNQCSAEPSTNTCKRGKSWCNVGVASSTQVISLPPKKKWRRQFRAAQIQRSHQENLRLKEREGQYYYLLHQNPAK